MIPDKGDIFVLVVYPSLQSHANSSSQIGWKYNGNEYVNAKDVFFSKIKLKIVWCTTT